MEVDEPSATQLFGMLMQRLCKANNSQLRKAAEQEQHSALGADQQGMDLEPSLNGLQSASTPDPVLREASSTLAFDQKIRLLLDTIEELRSLGVENIGIQIPRIVLIGDQSSGKSSVLESLAKVSLPKGMDMCTRMPLVLQMKDHSSPRLQMELTFRGEKQTVSEELLEEVISRISTEHASHGISEEEINLIMSKKGMPNLTLIDLPGITRVVLDDQPKNIEKQIGDLIMKYIRQEDTIILNVLPASVDFTICQSINMSREVDKYRTRTLAVVTKADQKPGGLPELVKKDNIKIGLGYVCVRNRLAGESHEEARKKEKQLFETSPLSSMDRSMVGILMLRNRLLQIQERQIRECLPKIALQIQEKLNDCTNKWEKLPTLPKEIESTFEDLMGKLIESLRMILERGEFQEYPADDALHCTARINESILKFYRDLEAKYPDHPDHPEGRDSKLQSTADQFLRDELHQLKETQGPWVKCYLQRNAFVTLLHGRVGKVAELPKEFMRNVWEYVKMAVKKVIDDKFSAYSLMNTAVKDAAETVIQKKKDLSIQRMEEMVEMEKHFDYTCNPEYKSKLEELKKKKDSFLNAPSSSSADMELLEDAFDLWIKMAAYWRIVVMRMVDVSAIHLLMSIKKLMDGELKNEITQLVLKDGQGLQKLLIESPEMAADREELRIRIQKLERAKSKVASALRRNVHG